MAAHFLLVYGTVDRPPVYKGRVYSVDIRNNRDKPFMSRLEEKCENCGENEYYHLIERSKLFKLFFIPIAPMNYTYFITCPRCNKYTVELDADEYITLTKYKLIEE